MALAEPVYITFIISNMYALEWHINLDEFFIFHAEWLSYIALEDI